MADETRAAAARAAARAAAARGLLPAISLYKDPSRVDALSIRDCCAPLVVATHAIARIANAARPAHRARFL